MQENLIFFFLLLFAVAFLYASVGHGGASGYLALMAIYAISPAVMKPTALLLNLFVSSVSFLQFFRGRHFEWQIFWPFALTSVPLSFVGGMLQLESAAYKKVLGILLLVPVARFLFFNSNCKQATKPAKVLPALFIGGLIGLLSGMIGIGGGILLSPILILLNWTDQKQAAAISAAFIFVNSMAGLGGQLAKGLQFNSNMLGYVLVAFWGGACGAYFGAQKFPQLILKNILAVVLLLASYKLLFTHA